MLQTNSDCRFISNINVTIAFLLKNLKRTSEFIFILTRLKLSLFKSRSIICEIKDICENYVISFNTFSVIIVKSFLSIFTTSIYFFFLSFSFIQYPHRVILIIINLLTASDKGTNINEMHLYY